MTLENWGFTGAAAWEVTAGSVGSAGAGGIDGNHVPWPGKEGLVRGWDEELWPPLVFAMSGMCEGLRRGEGFRRGE